PKIRNPKPETRNPRPKTRNPKLETRNSKPETRNPKPETRPGDDGRQGPGFCRRAHLSALTTQRAAKAFSAQNGPSFRYLIRRSRNRSG
ncbi:hypothetical protein T484DRAFT_1630487, partial [Baffinella frigidus]